MALLSLLMTYQIGLGMFREGIKFWSKFVMNAVKSRETEHYGRNNPRCSVSSLMPLIRSTNEPSLFDLEVFALG